MKHAKLCEDEIKVIEELAAKAKALTKPHDYQTKNLLGRIENICYLKRAEIKMQKRLSQNCEVGMPGTDYYSIHLDENE